MTTSNDLRMSDERLIPVEFFSPSAAIIFMRSDGNWERFVCVGKRMLRIFNEETARGEPGPGWYTHKHEEWGNERDGVLEFAQRYARELMLWREGGPDIDFVHVWIYTGSIPFAMSYDGTETYEWHGSFRRGEIPMLPLSEESLKDLSKMLENI